LNTDGPVPVDPTDPVNPVTPDPTDPTDDSVYLTVKYDTVNNDDVLTSDEAKSDKQTVTGTLAVGGDIDVKAGDIVKISVNGHKEVEAKLEGSKEKGFTYTVEVPTKDFITDANGTTLTETSKPVVVATFEAKDTAGNT
ncbi:Ig-like domain-containing protein, partial [Campylobacter mucosalis]|uniref:Ig-like domain-containing protein n=1 Tax=Campylobacter mucosalis TaxID=202 RepID=UPI00146FCFC4